MEDAAADPTDLTIDTYGVTAASFARRTRVRSPEVVRLLQRLATLVPGATVLEIGSGPGHDAEILERAGLSVLRTDATPAFVEMLRRAGHSARRLDIRHDPLGGPHDAVLANAILLHLTAAECARALGRILAATSPGGIFAFTVKEGDGARLTINREGRPVWFTYWRETPLREALHAAGWTVESLEHVAGSRDDWLHVVACRPVG